MRDLKTEEEIMANWKGDISKPVVSVCCITYNHEPYIEDALEGFLIQETDFPFEIIIHDDASIDRTADIIREYASAYPQIIKIILQTENQYLINVHLPFKNTWDNAKGVYIALCEGDDYWIAPEKLQMQRDKLEQNPEFNFTCTKVKTYNVDSDIWEESGLWHENILPLSKIIYSSGCISTPTIFVKSETVKNMPDFFFELAMVGDYFIQVIGGSPKGALYIDKPTSVYRKNSSSSVSNNDLSSLEKRMLFCKKMFRAYSELEEFIAIESFAFLKRKVRFKLWNALFFLKKNRFALALKVILLR